MRCSPLPPLLAGLLVAALAGCGSTTRVGSARTLRVALTEYRVTPQDARAPAGLLTIVVHNDGRLTHNLVLLRGGVTEASSPPIAPGQTEDVQAVLAPGKYLMASRIQSDQPLGAYGTLDVGS